LTGNIQKAETKKILWEFAETILPDKRIRDFNQGLMELGAVVCKPKRPACDSCPIDEICEANRLSIQDALPVKPVRKPIPHYDVTAGIIRKNGKILITLRPPRGLLGGLWEFPGGKKKNGEDLRSCLKREINEELGIKIDIGEHLISVKHAYTHFKITLHVFLCHYISGKIQAIECDDYRWITQSDFGRYAFPAADHKVIKKLMEIKAEDL
jgi:A/G-specific adenine glycosylase